VARTFPLSTINFASAQNVSQSTSYTTGMVGLDTRADLEEVT